MYEAAQMLNAGMSVFFLAALVSVALLILNHQNKILPKPETRIKLGKILSVVPFACNLGLLIGFLCLLVLQFFISTNYITVALFGILYGSGFSAVMGGWSALFGFRFSADDRKGAENVSKKYRVLSVLSMVISLLFLAIYLIVLIPIAMRYYGL